MSQAVPTVTDVIYVAPQRDWSFPLHKHDDAAELSLVLAGRGTLYHDRRNRVVERGMLVVKNAGLSHSERSDPDDPLEQVCVSVEGVRYEGLPENHAIPDDADPVIVMGDDFELARQCFLFLRDHSEEAGYGPLCSKVVDVVLDLARRRYSMGRRKHATGTRSGEELVSDAIEYLDKHYREKVRIRDLASRLFTSEGNLSRQFKRVTGFTVNEYVTSKRMGEAQRLLMFGDADIKDVASSCGYDNVQYFYHVFGEHAHCTPAEFRRRYRT